MVALSILYLLVLMLNAVVGQDSIMRSMQSSVVDISNYQCMQCLSGNSIYYCNNPES